MPPFENDPSTPEAEGAAAHIAELVRRTSERQARPGPSSAAPIESTIADLRPPAPVAPVAQPSTRTAPRTAPRTAAAQAALRPARPSVRQPSTRVLVAGGAIAALLIAGGLALNGSGGSDALPPSTAATAPPGRAASAPAGYTVQVTDVITDCARHSRSGTRTSFRQQNCVQAKRILGSGRVSGRPVLFVVARIQMPSGEAATSVKKVLDGTGTGNLNDLLREGRTFRGAPPSMPDSGYASVQSGAVIVVAEAGFSDGGASSNDDPALRTAAAQVAALVTARG